MAQTERENQIMGIIYEKINEMIGAGNQLFSMQFPAQPLNPNMYRYDTGDRNSILTKPFTIAEQEFRLSDQLFDISPITAGSNGEKLSVLYKTAINNFIPKLDYLAPFIRDRAGLGHWLLEDSGEKDENGESLTRIELCKNLYQTYLLAKNAWNEEKNNKFDSLKNKEGGLDEYAKWQSSYGMVRTEQLNNLYNDVVISGHLHEVLTILGYLNASSISEELELGKQKMRNSARLSLDESLTVYPVQFSPNNWFKALSPNLNPEDLTMAKASVRDIYLDKKKELSRAKSELQKAELMSTTPEEVKAAQKAVDAAKITVNEAESALIKQYGDGVVGVAKIYFNTFGASAFNKAKALELGADPNDVYIESLKAAVEGISATYDKQQALTTAIGNLSATMAKKAAVESKDWTLNKETMRQRVNELEMDVNYYGDLLSGITKVVAKQSRVEVSKVSYNNKTLIYQLGFSDTITGGSYTVKMGADETASIAIKPPATAGAELDMADVSTKLAAALKSKWDKSTLAEMEGSPGYFTITFTEQESDEELTVEEKDLLPTMDVEEPSLLPKELSIEDAEIQGMFSDIVVKVTDSSDKSSNSSEERAKATKWGVSLWLASASGSSESSSADTSERAEFFNQEIEVAFRVAKVSFDRGGWFNPQILKMSHAFSRLADIPVSPGLTVDDIQGKSQAQLSSMLKDKDGKNFLMPSFPVGMAIVKDVTIKVKKSTMSSAAAKSVAESASAASGGFLCFSVSSSSSSKNTAESAMHGAHGEYYYIRIPGPQVIGYFLQMVPKDTTELYVPTTKPDGKNPVLEAFEVYNNAPELLKGADKILKPVKEAQESNSVHKEEGQ